jgi:arylsulfatase A
MGRSTTSLNATDKWARAWNAPDSDSLAHTLKRANPDYRAAHFGKWQWPRPPEEFGYDASDGVTQNDDGSSRDPADPKLTFSLARRASAYLERQVKEGRPFYLQVSFYAPHSPAQALPATLRQYGGEAAPAQGGGKGQRGGGALMAAMTEDLDSALGMLFRRIEELGISGNTYVMYMSDNGMGSPLLKGGKALVDEGGIRVPLIVAGPGIRGGRHEVEPVIGYDVFPTILDLAAPGFPLPRGVEGGSWRPVLEGLPAARVQRSINRLVWHHDVEVDHPQTALRQGNLKLVHWWDTRQSFLYDLSSDAGESRNLAAVQPGETTRLLAELKAHVRAGLGERKFAALEAGQADPPGGRGEGRPKGKGKGGGRPPP